MARNCRTVKADEYIKENFNKTHSKDLIKEVMEKFNLKESTVKNIYEENVELIKMRALAEEKRKERELKKAQKEELLFKGRKREKILIDDSKLFAFG